MSALDYLQAHHDRILEELIDFARIPSVSTDPAYADGIEQAVQWVAERFHEAGPFDVRTIPTERHPAIFAQWQGAAGAPTLLVYGHYDVQPPDPLDKWQTPPFEPQVRDDRLYGRGVSDDKGPVLIPIKVAQAYFATADALPVNVKFLVEGGEEIGSPGLETLFREQGELFAADFVLSADGAMWRPDEPSITTASRGMTGLEFTLRGAKKDLHSGRHGGAVANPLHALARLVASLHTPNGQVAVAGFYDDVETLLPDEQAAISGITFDEQQYLDQTGAPELFGEPGYTTLERQWVRPTLELNGMWGGYQGPGSKSVIPGEAHAKITCRLVPAQRPDDIRTRVVEHLQQHVPPGVELRIQPDEHGALPYRIPSDHIGLQIAETVLREVYETEPLYVRMGGTLPVSELFKRQLGLDTVFFSFSTADEDFHAPNEFFRVQRLRDGLLAWALYWQRLAERSE